ncbi:Radical SAM domain protein [Desulfovibrio sp. X2]|uniref:radical SAM protein n=1 Tax=Desulfovibrio sp. X2 TaxID=941449 RepID=UPI000358B876|nr:radical SAM protein [Desulfovibrio sp. X2]EPR44467.1 Radical SAM domain protein [Desulfovibrio sp. X2]
MSKRRHITPSLLAATPDGQIVEHPDLLMVVRRGRELALPRPDELIPLPEGSDLFLLEGRSAVGLDPESGEAAVLDDLAVAAFVCPAHTLCATAAYATREGAPVLPLFAYGAVGFFEDRFYVAAKRVDTDMRQVFTNIDPERIRRGAEQLLKRFPKNRLVRHLGGCALTYSCPAARNLALGRFECPLPTAQSCNASCLGCISAQPPDSGFCATQDRITFRPTPEEIVEVMQAHGAKAKKPIFSFGQGCEGEPLTEAKTIASAVRLFRDQGGQGTVNVNTNGSLPATMAPLAAAGLDSIRVSLNSARPEAYAAYYRPRGYSFEDVRETIREAKAHGLHVSLNFLYFPGFSDSEAEYDALAGLVESTGLDFIQMRNLNLDPELYLATMEQALGEEAVSGPSMGLANFMKRLKKACPWIGFGYFNPYLEPDRPR